MVPYDFYNGSRQKSNPIKRKEVLNVLSKLRETAE